MINKDGGGGTIFRFYGGGRHSCYEGGHRAHGGKPCALINDTSLIAPIIMKFCTVIELDVFYTMVTKKFATSLLLRN